MSTMLLGMAFVGTGALVGGVTGWLLRGASRTAMGGGTAENPQEPWVDEHVSNSEVANVLCRLQELTLDVATNVDEHASYVREINSELTSVHQLPDVLSVVAKLASANDRMQNQLREAELKLSEQARQIEEHVSEARTDALTRLNNRRAFDDAMRSCREVYASQGRPTTVMMIDVDFFKKFNDTHGHAAGDEVLRSVAKILRRNVSSAEIVCRYGGEEFAIIFPGSDLKTALHAAERARAAITTSPIAYEGRTLRVTASAGLAEFAPRESEDDLIKRADSALYASKAAGRNCGHWNDGTINHPIPQSKSCGTAPPDERETQQGPFSALAQSRQRVLWSLSDRQAFQLDVDRRLAEWKRGGPVISVLAIAVDGFERFANLDGENHRETIEAITAQFLKAAMRDMDHVATFGNGVFGLSLPTARLNDAMAVGERIRRAIERCQNDSLPASHRVTISVGIAACSADDTAGELLERAEDALQSASQHGGNQCVALEAVRSSEAPAESPN